MRQTQNLVGKRVSVPFENSFENIWCVQSNENENFTIERNCEALTNQRFQMVTMMTI